MSVLRVERIVKRYGGIFGVLRNALPQIPGATFYDRLIVGLVVVVIVVMDQMLARRSA